MVHTSSLYTCARRHPAARTGTYRLLSTWECHQSHHNSCLTCRPRCHLPKKVWFMLRHTWN